MTPATHAKIKFSFIETNGIRLHVAFAGPETGPPVFLLHGFPEPWFGWERQIQPLADAGFHVIIPDQRGYNLSEKPVGIENYQQSVLVEDIIGLANALGFSSFHLAGHDFGGLVSWNLAAKYPDRIKKLLIANVPHPAIAWRFIRRDPLQILKSWYAIFFQIPGLPERLIRAGNWRIGIASLPGYFSEERRARYRAAWNQPGAMTGMLNWYRALARSMINPMEERPIQVNTLLIWGKKDRFLGFDMAPLSIAFCAFGKLVPFDDASHWVQHDKAAEISALMIEHFSDVD